MYGVLATFGKINVQLYFVAKYEWVLLINTKDTWSLASGIASKPPHWMQPYAEFFCNLAGFWHACVHF